MFDKINANLRKNEGFLISITCIPIPEYGQSNAPLISYYKNTLKFYTSCLNWPVLSKAGPFITAVFGLDSVLSWNSAPAKK